MTFPITVPSGKIRIRYYFFLAILDAVSMYRAFIIDKSLSSAILAGLAVISLPTILLNLNRIRWKDLFFVILFYIWVMYKSNLFYKAISLIVIINLITITIRPDRDGVFRHVLEWIAVAAAVCVSLQTLCHYLLGFHIPFVIEPLCTSSVQIQYHSAIKTGTVLGMYRPCAFFLEPAQYTCCCVYGLLSVLCKDKINYKKAIFISVGMILTTSGMGIALTFGLWIWRYVLGSSRIGILKRLRNVFGVFVLVAIAFLILSRFPFFNAAISRIFGDSDTIGAFQGRTLGWDKFFAGHHYTEFIWGFGYDAIPEMYITGFMTILYAYGIVGYALLLFFFLRVIFKGDRFVKMVCLIFLALMFVANVNGFIYTVFVLGLALSQGYKKNEDSLYAYALGTGA